MIDLLYRLPIRNKKGVGALRRRVVVLQGGHSLPPVPTLHSCMSPPPSLSDLGPQSSGGRRLLFCSTLLSLLLLYLYVALVVGSLERGPSNLRTLSLRYASDRLGPTRSGPSRFWETMIALSLSADRLQLLDFGAERFEFCFLSIDHHI